MYKIMPWVEKDVDKHKKGLNAQQKRRWVKVANAILAECIKKGEKVSDCEAKAIRSANAAVNNMQITDNAAFTAIDLETVTEGERTYVSAPVVIMVEGVHHGSRGPLLYTIDELSAVDWNNIPVTITHPEDQSGNAMSANSEGGKPFVIGEVRNVHIEGKAVKGRLFIDRTLAAERAEGLIEMLEAGTAIEVSAGLYSAIEDERGDFNGEDYMGIARHIAPDHLAVLPHDRGACSWDDGCGIRNKKNKDMELKDLKKDFIENGVGVHFIDNAAGFKTILKNIQGLLDAKDTDESVYILDELFDDRFIYLVARRGNGTPKYYEQAYSANENGEIELTGEPMEVVKVVEYKNKVSNKKSEKMAEKKAKPCNVDVVINNEATNFGEQDREWLEQLSDDQLKKMIPKAPEPVVNDEPVVKKDEEKGITINGKPIAEVIRDVMNTDDPEQFIDTFIPEGMRGQMKSGLDMYKKNREAMIDAIVKNTKFEKENLEKWSDADLSTLHESIREKQADFSLNAEPEYGNADTEEVEFMLNIQKDDK